MPQHHADALAGEELLRADSYHPADLLLLRRRLAMPRGQLHGSGDGPPTTTTTACTTLTITMA